MSLLLRISKKFLFSRTNDHFLSFITWVSVSGVALGVLTLIVVTSVINGFEGEIKKAVTGVNGDLILYTRGNPVSHPKKIKQKIKKVLPFAQAVTPSFVTELMVAGSQSVSGAVLEGIDAMTLGDVTEIPRRLVSGREPERDGEVMIGKALGRKIGAKVNDSIRLIVPFAAPQEGGKYGGGYRPSARQVKVVGVVDLGMYRYDSKLVYAPLSFVQDFLNQSGKATTFKIKLQPEAALDSLDASQKLYDNFGYPFVARNWAQLNRNLFYAIKLEKAVISVILTAIVLIAAFNVVSTLMMMIHDKTKEIAILKAIGLEPKQSFQLFLFIGGVIGFLGVFIGALIGVGLNHLIAKVNLIHLPSEIYHIGYLPVEGRGGEIAVILSIAFFITLAAALYPAIRVSTRSPLEGLRYE